MSDPTKPPVRENVNLNPHSVEFTMGQSGKIGCSVKSYGYTLAEALKNAKEGFTAAQDYIMGKENE